MDNLTWFGKFLIGLVLVAVSAVAVMFLAPVAGVGTLTYWQAAGITAIARILPNVW